jgi:hypothetical protein
MADNKNKRDGRDRSRIDSKDKSEVEYVHRKFPDLPHQAISGAIRAAGPNRDDVMKYLKEKKK